GRDAKNLHAAGHGNRAGSRCSRLEQILIQKNPNDAERVGRAVEVTDRLASVDGARRRHQLGIDAIARELLPIVWPWLAGACSRPALHGTRESARLEDRIRN